MMDVSDDCARFRALLAGHLQGDLAAADESFVRAHGEECVRCAEARAAALEADRLLSSWTAPPPPPHLAARILRDLASEFWPRDVRCADLRAEIDAWRAGDLEAQRAVAFEKHVARCQECARHARIAAGVDDLLARWQAPAVPAGFAGKVLAEWTRAERAARPPRRRPLLALVRSSVLAAAAALLIIGYVALRDGSSPTAPPESTLEDKAAADPLGAYEHQIRLQAVAQEQFPSAIGLFDSQPVLADRYRRKSGNLFHQSLRRTLASAAEAGAAR
ncbi:MAG: hypothetical protein HY812_00800 [Planctomycetes bacterium]|nr:hypothetical protein [Planctomycetota bacterium]